MINYALLVEVATLSHSSTASAGIILTFTIPAVLFSAVAGVYVDRQSKKWMLVITNIIRGFVVLAFLATVAMPRIDTATGLVVLYFTMLIFASVSQFFVPAEGATIPLLVDRRELVAANGLFNLTFTAAQLLGFAFLGPLFVALIGFQWLYLGLFAAYVLCAYLTWRLPERAARRPPPPPPGVRRGDKLRQAWTDLREGLVVIQADPGLITAIVYWAVSIAVFMMLGAVGPKFLINVLHISPDNLYFLMVPGGLGLLLGVLLVGRVATEANRPAMINLGLLAAGAGLLLLGITHPALGWIAGILGQPPPPIWLTETVMGALAFVLGLVNSFIAVPAQTVLQERTPEEVRARVLGTFYTVSNAILIVPILFAGGMADLLGAVQTVVAIAVLVLLVAIVGLRYQRAHAGLLTGLAPAEAAGAADALPAGEDAPGPDEDDRGLLVEEAGPTRGARL